ncbi:DUF1735 domain-containing protein [Sphingobacterium hungaricum]|uniref:DUF1735 domain-containing protein n=1 Tax=Sphingobacterium hungaricum TaxID=2082723 RepID=UPI0018CBE5AF|nr:DUF1735 domain-containing protein [Sphingobacterium hungaricum]
MIGPDAPGATSNIIEFKNIAPISSGTTAPFALYVPTTLDPEVSETTVNAIVRYSGVNDAPEDIVVNIEYAPAVITTYNTAQTTTYQAIAPASFTFPTTVTIKKGEREALVPIVLKTPELDPSISNAIALKITSVSTNDAISGNFGTVIYSFPVKSIWEGTYTYTITNNFGTIDGNIGGTFTETGVKLSTVGPNELYMQYLWRTYNGYAHYRFNGDDTQLTGITAFSGSNLAVTINEVILVDPVNKIFEVRWTGLGRGVIERFVRTGD